MNGWKHLARPGPAAGERAALHRHRQPLRRPPLPRLGAELRPRHPEAERRLHHHPHRPDGRHLAVGRGLAANDKGVFFCVGNGTWSADGKNLSESVVRLNFDTTLGDWFTPGNADNLNRSDLDLTAGVILGPGNVLFSGGKEGVIYVIDQMNMTHHNVPGSDQAAGRPGDPAAPSLAHPQHGLLERRLYVWPENSGMQAVLVHRRPAQHQARRGFNGYKTKHPGGVFSISADGNKAGTGIIWATLGTSGNAWSDIAVGTMVAVDATTGAKLWDSTAAGDAVGNFAKFSNPTVANGKVYVTSFAKVNASSPAVPERVRVEEVDLGDGMRASARKKNDRAPAKKKPSLSRRQRRCW
jgi:hypothetical protein